MFGLFNACVFPNGSKQVEILKNLDNFINKSKLCNEPVHVIKQ